MRSAHARGSSRGPVRAATAQVVAGCGEQGASSGEQGARSKEQGARSKEQGARVATAPRGKPRGLLLLLTDGRRSAVCISASFQHGPPLRPGWVSRLPFGRHWHSRARGEREMSANAPRSMLRCVGIAQSSRGCHIKQHGRHGRARRVARRTDGYLTYRSVPSRLIHEKRSRVCIRLAAVGKGGGGGGGAGGSDAAGGSALLPVASPAPAPFDGEKSSKLVNGLPT